jgi:hypothetical protein
MIENNIKYGHEAELSAVRDMTAAMLEAAENCRWAEVQRIDEARSKVLHALPAEVFTTTDESVRTILGAALSATNEVERQLSAERDRVGQELKGRKQRHHAVQAYAAAG